MIVMKKRRRRGGLQLLGLPKLGLAGSFGSHGSITIEVPILVANYRYLTSTRAKYENHNHLSPNLV